MTPFLKFSEPSPLTDITVDQINRNSIVKNEASKIRLKGKNTEKSTVEYTLCSEIEEKWSQESP